MNTLLLDADGVVLKKGEYFSERFAREHNVPIEKVLEFFRGPFSECQGGTKDLKEELAPFLKEWGWSDSVDDFLEYWFEDVQIDPDIYDRIKECNEKNISCYMASNNEKYRARAIEEKLGNLLDGYFFSADLKVKKDDPEFFNHILTELDVPAGEVAFVDNEEKNVDAANEVGIEARLYGEGVLSELINHESTNEFKNKFV